MEKAGLSIPGSGNNPLSGTFSTRPYHEKLMGINFHPKKSKLMKIFLYKQIIAASFYSCKAFNYKNSKQKFWKKNCIQTILQLCKV